MALTPKEIAWLRGGTAKITARVDTEEDFWRIRDNAKAAGIRVHVITDAGRTEFHNVPTVTALAIGPDCVKKIDKITGKLQLL